jgi:hypothetical protein
MKNSLLILSILVLLTACNSSNVLFENEVIEEENWVVEQREGGTVEFKNKTIEIIDAKGCTLWLKHKLSGPIKIEYDVIVIDQGGTYDRVSDLNCFWMSNDPKNKEDFFKNSKKRGGKFNNYHELTQYYVGYGGHNNSKTRFRRYDGNQERPLLEAHDLSDQKYLITPNKVIHITLIADNNHIGYLRGGEVVFELNDSKPYTSGYFGFRTVNNHMLIKNFKVTHID